MSISPILIIHICSGTLGLLCGIIAICVRKGSRSHGVAGIVFSLSMMSLAASGVYIAYTKSQPGNILGGVLTLYMVATAWSAARRRDGQTSMFDWVALLIALAVGASCVTYGFRVVTGAMVANDGVPAGMDFFLGFIVLLAAAGDIRMLVRGGVSGAQRIARHLWRMCFGLFIASGSFFMGRQQIFPSYIRKSQILVFLTILPLILLVFWLARVLIWKHVSGARRAQVQVDDLV
jgi:uncharacterized membrane protein